MCYSLATNLSRFLIYGCIFFLELKVWNAHLNYCYQQYRVERRPSCPQQTTCLDPHATLGEHWAYASTPHTCSQLPCTNSTHRSQLGTQLSIQVARSTHTRHFTTSPKGDLIRSGFMCISVYLSQCIQRWQFTDARIELYARNEGIDTLPAECMDHFSIILFFFYFQIMEENEWMIRKMEKNQVNRLFSLDLIKLDREEDAWLCRIWEWFQSFNLATCICHDWESMATYWGNA